MPDHWNHGFIHRHRVRREEDGVRLLDLLARRFPHADADEWRRRIESGAVAVGDERVSPDRRMREGEPILWRRPPWIEPDVPLDLAVLHRDAVVLAVAKPRGLPTLPGGGRFFEHTLLRLVAKRFPGYRPVHRLGTGTSGIVLCARTRPARAALSLAFQEDRVERIYVGRVAGRPPSRFEVTAPIGFLPHPRVGRVLAAVRTGRPARTDVETLESDDVTFGGTTSRVRVRIATGRAHQIRIHLAHAGHPLVGDPLYRAGGVPDVDRAALPSDLGYWLHAATLVFPHPGDGRSVRVTCGLPPPLRPPPAAGD